MLFLEYPKCSTCQKARKWLEAQGAAFTARHIKDDPPTAAELRQWWERSGLPLKKFFNTSGLKYKELGLKDKLPGMDEADVPSMAQVLRMATVGGARTTPYGDGLGTIEVGKGADLVLIDWDQIAYPYLDPETPLLDAVIQRAKTGGVTAVLCEGEALYADGRFTRVDRDAALKALHDDLSRALSDDEVERRQLSKALLPHAKRFYADYIDPSRHEPFYRPSSRV